MLSRVCPSGRPRWNQLDLAIVLLSIMGITLEEIEMNAALPINPTIIRIMRVLRIARGRPPPVLPGVPGTVRRSLLWSPWPGPSRGGSSAHWPPVSFLITP